MLPSAVLVVLVLCLCAPTAGHARTVRDFFVDEPGELFALLTRTTRLDMLDYYDSGTIVSASNNLGSGSRLDTVTDNFLRIHTSAVKVVELRTMRYSGDTIIAVIETINTPVPDSRITFYNKHWVALSSIKPFTMPSPDDFFLPAVDKKRRQELLGRLPFMLIELRFEGSGHELLVARHGLQRFLSREQWRDFQPYMRPELTYSVQGGKIKAVKLR